MNELEMNIFTIISSAGNARSLFIEAIDCAEEKNYELAEQKIIEAKENFINAHKIHLNLLSDEMNNDKSSVSLLLLHAEDQLMSAEAFSILAEKFIKVYKSIYKQ